MIRPIKNFNDGTFLYFDQGKFDHWCIYLDNLNGNHIAPKDIDYFNKLDQLSKIYGSQQIYNDFVEIYSCTDKQVSSKILTKISKLSEKYSKDKNEIELIFTIIYVGMIAEENKQNTKLGKRIKRLGMHQLLIKNRSAQEAANFMRHMGWKTIDCLCKERGF